MGENLEYEKEQHPSEKGRQTARMFRGCRKKKKNTTNKKNPKQNKKPQTCSQGCLPIVAIFNSQIPEETGLPIRKSFLILSYSKTSIVM